MPAGFVGAVLLHAAVIAATFFTWSHTLEITDQTPVVPIDLVTLADKTNVAPTVKEQSDAPPKEAVQPPAPEPAQTAQSAPPEDEMAPALEKPAPPVVPKPKPEQKKKEEFDPDNILALLDKRAATASSAPNANVANRTVKGIGEQNAMTADLKALLQSMIYKCWSPPVGVPHADQLIVSFELFLNPDGSVAQPPHLVGNSTSGANDTYRRAAEDSARRAIYTCAPYQLPADRYAQWRDVTFVFDPRQMVGQ